ILRRGLMRRHSVQLIQSRRRRPEEPPYGNVPGATMVRVDLLVDHLRLNRNTDHFLRSCIIYNFLKRRIVRAWSSVFCRSHTGRSTRKKHILPKSKHRLLSPKWPIGCSLERDGSRDRTDHTEAYQRPSRKQGHSVAAFPHGDSRNLHSGKLTSG